MGAPRSACDMGGRKSAQLTILVNTSIDEMRYIKLHNIHCTMTLLNMKCSKSVVSCKSAAISRRVPSPRLPIRAPLSLPTLAAADPVGNQCARGHSLTSCSYSSPLNKRYRQGSVCSELCAPPSTSRLSWYRHIQPTVSYANQSPGYEQLCQPCREPVEWSSAHIVNRLERCLVE